MIVNERFWLEKRYTKNLASNFPHSFGFNGFGEVTYFRTYSRNDFNKQETWLDTCIRVINGCMSIRKDWYRKVGLRWDEQKWQLIASEMLETMYQMKWLAPGRGLWAMGSDHVFNVGSMALNNCANTSISPDNFSNDIGWAMDALMCGCGVGYRLSEDNMKHQQSGFFPSSYTIPDSREGWIQSVIYKINASMADRVQPIEFIYDEIREYGRPIKGFGGVSSGPGPLIILHHRIEKYFRLLEVSAIDSTRLQCDVINASGNCVVSGNVRRGAQIITGSPTNKTFLDIKNYSIHKSTVETKRIKDLYDKVFELSKLGNNKGLGYSLALDYLENNDIPFDKYIYDRPNISGLSNNSCLFETAEDFNFLDNIAIKTREHADMGMLNLVNIRKFGRFGQSYKNVDYIRPDMAISCNPCGEIPLEDKELCNLVELFPTRCKDRYEFFKVTKLATIYAQTVSLLMTHSPETNSVLSRNRRIGVSISGIADWIDQVGAVQMTEILRSAYGLVRFTAREMAIESGVPEPIRVTTVKPSGTISQLAGVSSGMHFPTFRHAIRRIRISANSPMSDLLRISGVPNEPDVFNVNTEVFEFPIDQGKTRPATSVSAWEQFALLAMMSREWADNMVSCTIYFNEENEGPQLERMLGQFAPLIKSVSMLPHSEVGIYPQMPYEGITEQEYKNRLSALPKIDFNNYSSYDNPENKDASLYCENDSCET